MRQRSRSNRRPSSAFSVSGQSLRSVTSSSRRSARDRAAALVSSEVCGRDPRSRLATASSIKRRKMRRFFLNSGSVISAFHFRSAPSRGSRAGSTPKRRLIARRQSTRRCCSRACARNASRSLAATPTPLGCNEFGRRFRDAPTASWCGCQAMRASPPAPTFRGQRGTARAPAAARAAEGVGPRRRGRWPCRRTTPIRRSSGRRRARSHALPDGNRRTALVMTIDSLEES
jgi:hypothetical protein